MDLTDADPGAGPEHLFTLGQEMAQITATLLLLQTRASFAHNSHPEKRRSSEAASYVIWGKNFTNKYNFLSKKDSESKSD
jgi:hypothetical protein